MVEIISEYVPLKKRGGSFWGCCPFHGEKTPSFSVTPDKNFFYCYGCHVGGDVFTFVMKMENCTFPEALKLLANKLGIAVPEKEKTKAELEREKQAKQVIAANENGRRNGRTAGSTGSQNAAANGKAAVSSATIS